MEILEVFKSLNEGKVRYLLCGGLAVNIYGIPRSTADIDLLLDMSEDNLDNFSEVMIKIGYKPILPISIATISSETNRLKLEKEKNLIAYSYFHEGSFTYALDIVLKFPFSFKELYPKREDRMVDGVFVSLLPINDLIEMKLKSGRPQDLKDVKLLSTLI